MFDRFERKKALALSYGDGSKYIIKEKEDKRKVEVKATQIEVLTYYDNEST